MFFQQKEMHVSKKCWGVPPMKQRIQQKRGTVTTSMELLFTLFHMVHIMMQHLTCFWEAFLSAWFAHLNCNPHSLPKNHRGCPNTVCGLEREKPKVERSFHVSFSQQTFFAYACCCPLEVTVQETPPKKHIQHSPSSSKIFAFFFLQAQTPTFDESLLNIWIQETYNQPLTKTKKTKEEKFWKKMIMSVVSLSTKTQAHNIQTTSTSSRGGQNKCCFVRLEH
jgi:hypothetical protein